MKLSFTSATLLALCSFSSTWAAPLKIPSAASIASRDADFASVRTKLKESHNGKDGPEKYFHESTFHPHYDGRFASKKLEYEDKKIHLTSLVQTYLSTMNDIGAETWIMHGSLLGWFWNRKTMPWDSDIDVQMSEKSMEHLSKYYNMTIHHYKLPDVPGGRDYMLEINPHWVNGSIADKANMIDARWIDTDTGLFIDITTLRPNLTAQAEGHEGYMMCKDKHHYNYTDIFPLRESIFENTPVKIPYAYTDLLIEEYSHKALVVRDYENHHFDQETMEWMPISKHLGGGPPKSHPKSFGYNPLKGVNREPDVGKAPSRFEQDPKKDKATASTAAPVSPAKTAAAKALEGQEAVEALQEISAFTDSEVE